MVLLTVSKSQNKLAEYTKRMRLNMGLTQTGLAKRSGVSLATLRKFEQKGIISLESYLKLLMVLKHLSTFIEAMEPEKSKFLSIDDVLKNKTKKSLKKGWRS